MATRSTSSRQCGCTTGCEPGPGRPEPDGLRPAQLGIVLVGRVILGHVGATVADLAERGYVRPDETPAEDHGDWELTDLRGQVPDGARLLQFEATLLKGLFAGRSTARLSGRGDELLARVQAFRRELRRLALAGDQDQLEGLAPYAMIFGFIAPPAVGPDGRGPRIQQRPDPATKRSSGASFGREWSARSGHHHDVSDHSQAHGLDAGYGHTDAGHGALGGGLRRHRPVV
jgi:hypothetical protein